MQLPRYYSSLAPFREVFATSKAILTYHHVGSRPPGARIKGLYVSPNLFAGQLNELKAAGFYTPQLDSAARPGGSNSACIYLTFDDGFRDVFDNALPRMQELQFCGIQFLVAGLLGKTNEWQQRVGDVSQPLMDHAQVREWLAADQQIGSHTLTHPRLTQLPLAKAREEITASKKCLEDRFGLAIEHFCYPYGDWNEEVRELVIAAGYKTACTTKRGINRPGDSSYELKRFMARYPSRSLKQFWSWLSRAS